MSSFNYMYMSRGMCMYKWVCVCLYEWVYIIYMSGYLCVDMNGLSVCLYESRFMYLNE